MENTLDYLLQVEAKAAAMISEAQAEADKRIHDNEEKQHAVYEECFKVEVQAQEVLLQENNEKIKVQYQQKLDEYRNEISSIDINKELFFETLNKFIAAEG
jgi:vacuolar-type H+-ATPase subunit H